jgi:hypothetical protein
MELPNPDQINGLQEINYGLIKLTEFNILNNRHLYNKIYFQALFCPVNKSGRKQRTHNSDAG